MLLPALYPHLRLNTLGATRGLLVLNFGGQSEPKTTPADQVNWAMHKLGLSRLCSLQP